MDTDAIRRAWPDVLGRIFGMRRATWTFVSQHAQVLSYDGRTLTLGIGTVGLTNTFRQGNHAELVRQALIDELGVDAVVDGVPMPEGGATPAAPAHVAPPEGSVPRASDDPPPAPPAAPQSGPQADAVGDGLASSVAPDSGPRGSTGGPEPIAHRSPAAPGGSSLQHNSGWGSSSDAPPDWASAAPRTAAPDWATGGAAAPSAPASSTVTAVRPVGAATTSVTPPGAPSGASPSGDASADQPPAAAVRGASAVRQSFAQARSGSLRRDPGGPRRVTTDDSAVSEDDEDIEHSGDVGRAVIEKVLGGRVLEETQE
jgi:DNA polymerase-3 subunit gamma/tau